MLGGVISAQGHGGGQISHRVIDKQLGALSAGGSSNVGGANIHSSMSQLPAAHQQSITGPSS